MGRAAAATTDQHQQADLACRSWLHRPLLDVCTTMGWPFTYDLWVNLTFVVCMSMHSGGATSDVQQFPLHPACYLPHLPQCRPCNKSSASCGLLARACQAQPQLEEFPMRATCIPVRRSHRPPACASFKVRSRAAVMRLVLNRLLS
jgi:hypothetical protein